ncbi:MAG: hypothetical protein ACE5LB_11145 [Acidiferrobacterales bacterium]
MYPRNRDENDLLDSVTVPEIREAWTDEDLPEPAQSWALSDFDDLLPDDFDIAA